MLEGLTEQQIQTLEEELLALVEAAVVRAMQSHMDLAEHVMKHDQQAMDPLIGLVYELLKSRSNISLAGLGS